MPGHPSAMTFSGHETFPVRYSWLKKGVDAVAADGGVFRSDEAMIILGVGKNMVRSIRHWCLAAGVLAEVPGASGKPSGQLRVTEFGQALFGEDGWDPYLEDQATLWLLHWQIASNARRCTTWHWAYSHFHEPEFTRDSLTKALLTWVRGGKPTRVTPTSLLRDVDCFLRTYMPPRRSKSFGTEETLDCPLAELGLIRTVGDDRVFRFHRGAQPNLPDGVLIFAILAFWEATASEVSTLSVQDLARQPGGPGQLFKLDEQALTERCEVLEGWTEAAVGYRETAGLRLLYRRRPVRSFDILGQSYSTAAFRGKRL